MASQIPGGEERGLGQCLCPCGILVYDCEKGAGIKPFTRASLWIMGLVTLRVQGGGTKGLSICTFQNNL